MLVYYFVCVTGTVETVAQNLTDSPGDLTVWARLVMRAGRSFEPGSSPEAGCQPRRLR